MKYVLYVMSLLMCSGALAQRPELRLPFPPGDPWQLTHGYLEDTPANELSTHIDYGLWADDRFAVDFASSGCRPWRAPALAAADGIVDVRSAGGPYGRTLFVDHGNGYKTRYAHLDQITVRNGEFVSRGDQIGLVGNSGNAQGHICAAHPGTHLHFALYHNGVGQRLEPISGIRNFAVTAWYRSDNDGNNDCHQNTLLGSAPFCSAGCTCAVGEGDCDADNECQAGLVCNMDVGPNYGMAGWVDVCEVDHVALAPPPPVNCHVGQSGNFAYCSVDCKCSPGEGDCDNNNECVSGSHCENNIGPQFGWHPTLDVCMPNGPGQIGGAPPAPPPAPAPPPPANCHADALGGYNYCSVNCPCASGQGDCDGNNECQPGNTCENNIGAQFGWGASVDVCMPAAAPSPPPAPPRAAPANPPANCHAGALGSISYCSAACPCAAGQGDCDGNYECQAGLVCGNNVGARYGWPASTDVCEHQ